MKLYLMGVVKKFGINILSCRYVWFFIKHIYARWDEMRWDSLGSHDQGNQSRNGLVYQTVALVKRAVLAEKSAR
jgi:hypothetical protein